MAFLHPHSQESTTAALDLWALPGSQTAITDGNYVHYLPVTSLDDTSCVEFNIQGASNEYIDLPHCLLFVRCKIVDENSANLAKESDAAPVNNFLHTIWSNVEVSLNNQPISQSGQHYAYRAYLSNLLNYGPPAKDSHLAAALWYSDSPGTFDQRDDANVGYASRKVAAAGSKIIELIGPIHADIFSQERCLLNNVSLNLKLTRNKDAFCLMSGKADKVKLVDCRFIARKVKPSPDLLLAHAKALQISPAKYPIIKTDIKNFTIPSGIQSKTVEWSGGLLPRRLVIGIVSNKAFSGDYKANPFHFSHFQLNYLTLYADSVQVPSHPFTPDFTKKQFIQSYYSLFTGSGIHFGDSGNDISKEDYEGGSCLHCFDLTPCLTSSQATWNLQKPTNLRVEVRFAAALPEAVNLIVLVETDNLIQIDKQRSVLTDFSV